MVAVFVGVNGKVQLVIVLDKDQPLGQWLVILREQRDRRDTREQFPFFDIHANAGTVQFPGNRCGYATRVDQQGIFFILVFQEESFIGLYFYRCFRDGIVIDRENYTFIVSSWQRYLVFAAIRI